MYSLLECVLNGRNRYFFSARRFALCFAAGIAWVLAAAGAGVTVASPWSGTVLLLLAGALLAAIAGIATAIPYEKTIRRQSDEHYLFGSDPKDAERYFKDVLGEPRRVLKRADRAVFSALIGWLLAETAAGCAASAIGSNTAAFGVNVTFAAGLLIGSAGFAVYRAKTVHAFVAARSTSIELLRAKKYGGEQGAVPKNREVRAKLAFADEQTYTVYRRARLAMRILIPLGFGVWLVPMPIVNGAKSVLGVALTAAFGLLLFVGAIIAHVVQSAAVKRSEDAQEDTGEGHARKMLARLLSELYARWFRPFCAAVGTAILYGAAIGYAELFGALPLPDGATAGWFVMTAVPLFAVVLLSAGASCLTGFRLFKRDYVRYAEFLHDELLPFSESAETGGTNGSERA